MMCRMNHYDGSHQNDHDGDVLLLTMLLLLAMMDLLFVK